MQPISMTVVLSHGNVSLRAWGAHLTDALTLDLLTVTATLGELREGGWQGVSKADIEQTVWGPFWRLVHLALEQGAVLPARITWGDRLALLETLWRLNSLEEAEGKLQGLSQRVQRAMARRMNQLTQAHQMTAWTSSS